MKRNNILYISRRMDPLLTLQARPGETIFISSAFINELSDEQFREFTKLNQLFKVNKAARELIRDRCVLLNIGFTFINNNLII
jgi:hypothetical protein